MLLLLLLAAPLIKWISTALLPTQGRDTPALLPTTIATREEVCERARGLEGVFRKWTPGGWRGRNMTIYEQRFMKQDGEHARGGPAARPGSPSGASLTQQTCTHPPTRANTQKHTPRRGSACVHCQSDRKRHMTVYWKQEGFWYFTSRLRRGSAGFCCCRK